MLRALDWSANRQACNHTHSTGISAREQALIRGRKATESEARGEHNRIRGATGAHKRRAWVRGKDIRRKSRARNQRGKGSDHTERTGIKRREGNIQSNHAQRTRLVTAASPRKQARVHITCRALTRERQSYADAERWNHAEGEKTRKRQSTGNKGTEGSNHSNHTQSIGTTPAAVISKRHQNDGMS